MYACVCVSACELMSKFVFFSTSTHMYLGCGYVYVLLWLQPTIFLSHSSTYSIHTNTPNNATLIAELFCTYINMCIYHISLSALNMLLVNCYIALPVSCACIAWILFSYCLACPPCHSRLACFFLQCALRYTHTHAYSCVCAKVCRRSVKVVFVSSLAASAITILRNSWHLSQCRKLFVTRQRTLTYTHALTATHTRTLRSPTVLWYLSCNSSACCHAKYLNTYICARSICQPFAWPIHTHTSYLTSARRRTSTSA